MRSPHPKILLVDASPYRDTRAMTLAGHGYEVQSFMDAQQAARFLGGSVADLVLFVLDGRSASAFDIAEEIRRRMPRQRTGLLMTDGQCRLLLDGREIHVMHHPDNLIAAITTMLDQPA